MKDEILWKEFSKALSKNDPWWYSICLEFNDCSRCPLNHDGIKECDEK